MGMRMREKVKQGPRETAMLYTISTGIKAIPATGIRAIPGEEISGCK